MLPYAIAAAVVAAAALLSGLIGGERNTIILGLVGVGLAWSAFRGSVISPFLRVFLVIFSAEFVLIGLAFLIGKAGYWPDALKAMTYPSSCR